MVEVKVGPMEAGKKVHRFVRQLLPGVPLSGIHKMLRMGRVKRNGKKAKPDDVIEIGDIIRLYMSEEDYAVVSKPVKKFGGIDHDIDVVYEDAELLVVNKPVGLLTHGTAEEHKDTLVNQVLAYLHHNGELDQRVFTPSPVNRLDRNTSGLVLFAKTGQAARELATSIGGHDVRKWYLAIVDGLIQERGEIRANLARQEEGNRTRVSRDGKNALTRYERLAAASGTSVVKVELVSGRTHQIRAHFSHIGHPLRGDFKYGGERRSREDQENHQLLHAGWLRLADGREFTAPLPPAFRDELKKLGYPKRVIDELMR